MYVYIHINLELMMLIAYGKVKTNIVTKMGRGLNSKTYSMDSINFRMNVCVYIYIYSSHPRRKDIYFFRGPHKWDIQMGHVLEMDRNGISSPAITGWWCQTVPTFVVSGIMSKKGWATASIHIEELTIVL